MVLVDLTKKIYFDFLSNTSLKKNFNFKKNFLIQAIPLAATVNHASPSWKSPGDSLNIYLINAQNLILNG